MKILYINTEEKIGGAAIACDRLRSALRQIADVEDLTIVHRRTTTDSRVVTVASLLGGFRDLIERALKRALLVTGLQYRLMPATHRAVLAKARAFKPDIINLHNLHAGMDGYFPLSLFKPLSEIAPLVWTFHDMWPLTGHCAYDMECGRWEMACGQCPRLNEYPALLIDKSAQNLVHKAALFQAADITVVTPSLWLGGLTRRSASFFGKRVETINNGVDPEIFTQGDRQQARAALGLAQDAPVLMFVAKRASDNERKGSRELFEIVDKLSKRMNRPVTLVTLGEGDVPQSSNPNVSVVPLGYVSDEKKMATVYQAADIFLFPTRADNLPNTLVEAVCCGTPCATFDIGGCGEIIEDDVNGILVQPFEVDLMVDRLLRFFNSDEERARLAAVAFRLGQQRYHWHVMAANYLALMQELLSARQGRRV